MKTNEDMASSILNRVSEIDHAKMLKRKKMYKTSALVCMFVFVLAVVFNVNQTATQPSEIAGTDVQSTAENHDNSESANAFMNKNFSLIVASAAEENKNLTAVHKESKISIPFGGILTVYDVANMTAEEKLRMYYDLKCRLQELYATESGWHTSGDEASGVYFGTMEQLRLSVEDAHALESIILSCTENGKLTVLADSLLQDMSLHNRLEAYAKSAKQGREITVSGEEFRTLYNADGMTFKWFVSDALEATLQNTPDLSLASISDIISGTITYIDGTQEHFTITLNFDENGILSAQYSYQQE